MVLASKLIECGCILHNLAIKFGFSGEELQEEDQPGHGQADGQGEHGGQVIQGQEAPETERVPPREQRQNELLAFFS